VSREARHRKCRPAVAGALSRYRRYSTTVLRVSVGLVFIWFGAMKFIPGASPAEDVATRTMDILAFGLVPPDASRPLLALLETVIGLGLITGVLLRLVLAAFFIHMAGVFAALLILPGEMWNSETGTPTLEGQYILKNVVLIAACLTVAADEGFTGASRCDRKAPSVQEEPPQPSRAYEHGLNDRPDAPGSPTGGPAPGSRPTPW
jgi:uncharacterized membrane protein YphA (DoxX/SURF4 family)